MNNPKAKKVGDQWVKRFGEVEYLMEKQPNGVNKAIKRITPYVNPRKANSLSRIPETAGKPVSKKMPIQGGNNWMAERLNLNKEIKIRKPEYETKRVQIDRRTWVVVPATMTNETAIANYQQKYSR